MDGLKPDLPDNVFPPATPAYELLYAGQCDDLLAGIQGAGGTAWDKADPRVPEPLIKLYTAAAHACRGRLDKAKEFIAGLTDDDLCEVQNGKLTDSSGSYLDENPETLTERERACETQRRAVFRWTKDVIAALEVDPNYRPTPSGD